MGELLQWIGHYWWLGFVVAPVVGGWAAAASKYAERRRRDRIELERVRRMPMVVPSHDAAVPPADPVAGGVSEREVARALADHDAIARRWLDMELDVAKLIDYPLMTDMREPLTQAFHRARRVAEGLRPDSAADPMDRAGLDRFHSAVHDFEIAFDAALAEARRRAQSDFSVAERSRLERAQRLMAMAADEASTQPERQRAYVQAKRELDGLIVLPGATTEDLERRVAGELEA